MVDLSPTPSQNDQTGEEATAKVSASSQPLPALLTFECRGQKHLFEHREITPNEPWPMCPECGGDVVLLDVEKTSPVTEDLSPKTHPDFLCMECGEENGGTWWPTCEWCDKEQT
jgi:hypothetical protein